MAGEVVMNAIHFGSSGTLSIRTGVRCRFKNYYPRGPDSCLPIKI